MKIGICDDMLEYVLQIRKKCECYFENKCIKHCFFEFLSGEEVLEHNGHIDILFLDIEMNGGIDGIQTMEELLKCDNVWKIVFVTNYDDKFKFTYGLKTLGYISKPVSDLDIEKWLDIAVNELNENKILRIIQQKQITEIDVKSIIYMESDRNNTYIFTRDEKILTSNNMKYWEEETRYTSLIRIHKSFIVNIDYVADKYSDYVKMEIYNTEIPIGRKYREKFNSGYIKYIGKRIRNRIK